MSDITENTEVQGTIRVDQGIGVVRMQGRYDTDIDDLWSALTVPDRLARWVADVHGDLQLGGTFEATFTSGWEGPGTVQECEPPRRLVLRMGSGADEGVIEATLRSDGDATVLTVEERGLPVPELHAHGAGWQAHMEDLAAHLAGQERGDWSARWAELDPEYLEQASKLR